MKAVAVNTIDLLTTIEWAKTRSEARRMIQSGGLWIDGERHEFIDPWFFAGSEFIMHFGKRRWAKIIFPAMKQYYKE